MLIPFRVKNPIRHFPYATVALMTAMVVSYAMTSQNHFLEIQDVAFNRYSFAMGLTPFWKFFTAMFLHKDILHLLVDVLFLSLFGAPVEDRIRIPRFLLIFFLAGAAGAVFQAYLDTAYTGAVRHWVGSTGSVMGIVGAYWYVFAWSAVSIFYWLVLFHGVIDVAAFWVVGFFLVVDLVMGTFDSKWGAVTNLSHVGAGAVGIVLCLAARVKRDSEAVSEAKALLADDRNISNLPLHAIEALLEHDPKDVRLIRGMLPTAFRTRRMELVAHALHDAGPEIMDKDPRLVADYLLDYRGDPKIYRPIHLIHLAGLLERIGEPHRAVSIYRLTVDRYPDRDEAETALYRMAHCSWETLKDASAAKTFIEELGWRFPNGEMQDSAQKLLDKIGA